MPYALANQHKPSIPQRVRLWQRLPYCHRCKTLLDKHQAQLAEVTGDQGRPVAVLACIDCREKDMNE
jgi:hypothetical protein